LPSLYSAMFLFLFGCLSNADNSINEQKKKGALQPL
jgi:hypothetical protein